MTTKEQLDQMCAMKSRIEKELELWKSLDIHPPKKSEFTEMKFENLITALGYHILEIEEYYHPIPEYRPNK